MAKAETVRETEKALEEAVKLFEAHPDFPRVQVRMRERMEEAARNSPADARAFGSKARMQYVLSRFDIRAESFLELVSDIRAQNAFMVVLADLERVAWQEYTGWPIEVARPASAQADADLEAIHAKVQRWTYDGYKRVESLHKAQHEPEDGPAAKSGSPLPQPAKQSKKRGPKPDHETAARVAEIVARVVPDGDWHSKVDEVCDALDEEKIPCPKTWRHKDRTCRQWSDRLERSIRIKAIEYRLEIAKQRKKTTPETLS